MIKLIKKENTADCLRYAASAAVCFTLSFLILYFPEKAGSGITEAVELCLHTVIPTLFPFLFVSSLAVSSSLYMKLAKPFEKLTRRIFRLPGEAAGIIVMSLTGGFPVGAQMTCCAYEDGSLTENEAQRLSLFAVNAGPGFVINTVGLGMAGSYRAGVIIYASLVISCLTVGFLTRFLDDGSRKDEKDKIFRRPLPFSQAAAVAARKSPVAMLNICVWIILFNCLIHMLSLNSGTSSQAVIYFLEVTAGCKAAALKYSAPVLAGIIGWSGLSVHCQLMPYNIRMKTDIKLFFASRVLNGAFSSLICQWLIKLFPTDTAVFSYAARHTPVLLSGKLPVSAGLLIMCALLLLGENFTVKKEILKF